MSTDADPGRGRLPALTGDARVDRWREHRVAVQAELVESTLGAIEEHGPDLSIDDVVKAAGVPRPKLYRFFHDKESLFAAVAERAQELVIEAVVPQFDLAGTARGMVHSGLAAYVDLVDERPNLFRFLVGSHFRASSASDLIESGRPLSDAVVAMLSGLIRARDGDGDGLEYVVDAGLGAVALGVLRWLNAPAEPGMPGEALSKAQLVEQLTVFLWGALAACAESRGVALDPDAPIGETGSAV
ncbi:TetR/AcrR family transcriptional regulator [Mycolicibacterium brumae]|uniref:TetR/AcrR family transcriptional regulator n=1 Tax=Mycolicibacterium brumae TaxID=85968 RepID=A0A2G5PBT0_9MYCO|nr:TetR/AcrR family transcriptional regulator [Mycolicibacterium brumae]MCV7191396.1 TetR/AcrR family transcriptional regulator [Mycolicibacterium brumae]PIB75785.1 TetR/AcrR family transcriptional regulator [Mycolicibacterium brumae]UWW09496.1 TetR/AcrR family transcriptional regulator [Mycolicibacterium brumae]